MTNLVYNEGKFQFMSAGLSASSDWRISLHGTSTTLDTQNDGIATNTNFTTPDEFSGTNYTAGGVALASEAVTKVDASDRAEFDAADVTFTSIGDVSSAQVQGILVYKFITAWSSSVPVAWIDVGTNLPFRPNGGNVTITWASNGIINLTMDFGAEAVRQALRPFRRWILAALPKQSRAWTWALNFLVSDREVWRVVNRAVARGVAG